MRVGCFKGTHITNVFLAEAITARKGLEFARDLGLKRIILEEDALNVMKSLDVARSDYSPIGTIIEETKLLVHQFHKCKISHASREKYRAANSTAKLAL
ncbi:hypothetical protein REPUB_Repub06bG0123100 [Reevesia pubescens]